MTYKQKVQRVHSILYSTDSREELAERIVALEELAETMHAYMSGVLEHNSGIVIMTTGYTMLSSRISECEDRMKKLGLEA